MKKILITGGTVFVSRYTAAYFAGRGFDVYVLNRNSRPQVPGVTLIEADRNHLGNCLKGHSFDAVLDITGYTAQDAEKLVTALGDFQDYIFISSSAVYPETTALPFHESAETGPNCHWGAYGTGKLEAEQYLRKAVPQAYILRPPYLYGPMQNLYREPFVFECAERGYPFPIPGDGSMPLQFFHVRDLCRFMELLLEQHPAQHIFNVGNPETVTIHEWAQLCYDAVGAPLTTVSMGPEHPRWAYFPFRDYAYELDVTAQLSLMPDTTPLADGLKESWAWFSAHKDQVTRKPYFEYLDRILSEM